ncbi:LOC495955 protein, related [Eimeria praecox]|uniref:protein-histidine N-methyltransferase n=1 Tax=Eimeria praecox TaxID=51316 RepID=U6GX30_9EIME|nr:LOC495955 protein, related [Eimeria praecox]
MCPFLSVKKGEYEGGFSIWECTWDLLGFLQKSDKREVNEVLSLVTCGHVLDLGCGHGLLGIWALKTGAPAVVFQDLNENVLKQATRWNILKNTENSILGSAAPHQHQLSACFDDASPLAKAARFGDLGAGSIDDAGNSMESEGNGQRKDGRALCLAASWEKYPKIHCSCQGAKPKATAEIKTTEGTPEGQNETVQEKDGSLATGIAETDMTGETLRQPNAREIGFSVIFCSEGIYREETFEPLAAIFKRLLHKDGIALVASKRYYFGIGGGSLAFMSFLREKYSDALSVEVADSFRSANSNNFRDVLLIRKKDKPDAQV